MVFRDKVDVNAYSMPLWNESTSILPLDAFFKPKHACAVKPEVLKSWTLEMDYSRAPCLGADQKTCGLWERDCRAARISFASFGNACYAGYCILNVFCSLFILKTTRELHGLNIYRVLTKAIILAINFFLIKVKLDLALY